jgi:ligand-binding SRPBCC domain-containing protein
MCVREWQLLLPERQQKVFAFFADARNLQALTPPWLDFSITTPGEIRMESGTIIDYRLRVHGFSVRWQSEITCWDPPLRFVDEQRRGPYKTWVHEHRFEGRGNSTAVIDHVRYSVRGGHLIDWLFVRRDIERIFEFRRRRLLELFGSEMC